MLHTPLMLKPLLMMANYTFAKNIVGTVAYYDTENKVKEDEKSHIVWADLTFTF